MYKTIQGDTWDIVAKKLLGSEMYMSDLIRVNPDYQEYVIFPAGVELNVPKVEQTTAQEESMLPPWKRKDRNGGAETNKASAAVFQKRNRRVRRPLQRSALMVIYRS